MSRTYRRKNGSGSGWRDKEWYCSEYIVTSPCGARRVPLEHYTFEYKAASARYHSDSGTYSFKEPGPSWFRNLFTERPLRRYNKKELRKFMSNPEYEPMCSAKGKLEYWT